MSQEHICDDRYPLQWLGHTQEGCYVRFSTKIY